MDIMTVVTIIPLRYGCKEMNCGKDVCFIEYQFSILENR